eukprot:Tamp_20011.p1 GENE.Tamp_20011~~Tamp_20011.p1  ORF type:complete len:156 (+),score=39.40 Tamp_20011:218-685(+)
MGCLVAPERDLVLLPWLWQWLPATLMIIAAAACFCAVVIRAGTGSSQPQGASVLMQLNSPNGLMLAKQARMTMLDDELPLKTIGEYDDVGLGLHQNEADSGVPDDFIDALNDCSQDADCWAVRTKPERETNSERMPLFRLNAPEWPEEEEEEAAE